MLFYKYSYTVAGMQGTSQTVYNTGYNSYDKVKDQGNYITKWYARQSKKSNLNFQLNFFRDTAVIAEISNNYTMW